MPAIDVLDEMALFSALNGQQRRQLAASLTEHHFPPRTVVFHQDEPGRSMYIVASGAVRVYLTNQAGHELTLAILTRGEVFGEMALFGQHPRSASVMTFRPTDILKLGREDLHRYLLEVPALALQMLELLADRLRATTAFAAETAFSDRSSRTARVLLALAEHLGTPTEQGIALDIELTQADLAALVGITRETVNRVMGSFRDQRLVVVSGTHIILSDPAGLRRITAHGPMALEV